MAEYLEYIEEIKRGPASIAAFKIVRLFENQVFTMCYRIIKNREEAEEVAQDVFLKCFKKISQLDDNVSFPAWLMKIAYTSSIDHVRKKKQKTLALDNLREEITSREDGNDSSKLSESEIFENSFSVLEDDERGLVNLFYQEGMAVKEIAEIAGLSKSNVKVKLYRARIKIRDYLVASGKFKSINTQS